MLPLRLVVLGRTLAIAFWTVATGFGVYWIAVLDFGAGTFWRGLHEFSAGVLLVLVAAHCAYSEVRETIPGYSGDVSRLHQLGLGCLHVAVGGFVTDTSRGGTSPTQFGADILGFAMFVSGWVLAALKVMFAFQPKAPRPPEPEPAEPASSRFSWRRSTAATATPAPQPRASVAQPAERRESRRSFASPFGAPPLLNDEDRERSDDEEEGSRASHRSSVGLCPDVARWEPDSDCGPARSAASRRSDALTANPFGSG